LERWGELLNWHNETSEQLAHVRYQLEGSKVQMADLNKVASELDAAEAKLATWRKTAAKIDEDTQRCGLQVSSVS